MHRKRRRQRPIFASRSSEWTTPPALLAELEARFGPFDLDPCATADNATAPRFFTRADDGLTRPWAGRVFVNPPYGRTLGAWVEKAWRESRGGADLVVCLLPARTDTAWWPLVMRGEVEFLRGRLRFGGADNGAPFASVVVVFRDAERVTKGAAAPALGRDLASPRSVSAGLPGPAAA